MSTAQNTQPVRGNPSSAQPMGGLSSRAQARLDPRKNGHMRGTPVEPQGAALARLAKRKAAI